MYVLVHGLGVSGRYMVPLLRLLGREAIAWAPDLPGFGRSPGTHAVLDINQLAHVLGSWMDQRGISRAILVGHSMGCQVVTQLAVARPQSVAALVLIAPTMDRGVRGKWFQIARWLVNASREPLAMVWLAIRDYLRAGFRRTWRTFALARRARTARLYSQVRCPALVMRGGRDLIVSQRWAAHVAAAMPGGQLIVLPAGAHAVQYARPLEAARAVQKFVTEAGAASKSPTDA